MTVNGLISLWITASTASRIATAWSPCCSTISTTLHSRYAASFFRIGARVLPSDVRLAIQRALRFFGGGKEFLREVSLSGIEHVQYSDPAFNETLVHAAVFSQRDHQQWRFERCLRHPCDGGGAVAVTTARSDHVHSVGQQAEDFLFRFGVHK